MLVATRRNNVKFFHDGLKFGWAKGSMFISSNSLSSHKPK